jgi:hypothetical protein
VNFEDKFDKGVYFRILGVESGYDYKNDIVYGEWNTINDYLTNDSDNTATYMVLYHSGYDEIIGSVDLLDNTMIFDVTDIFGAGNEPSQAEFEELLSHFKQWHGEGLTDTYVDEMVSEINSDYALAWTVQDFEDYVQMYYDNLAGPVYIFYQNTPGVTENNFQENYATYDDLNTEQATMDTMAFITPSMADDMDIATTTQVWETPDADDWLNDALTDIGFADVLKVAIPVVIIIGTVFGFMVLKVPFTVSLFIASGWVMLFIALGWLPSWYAFLLAVTLFIFVIMKFVKGGNGA